MMKGDTIMRRLALFIAVLVFLVGMAGAARGQTATGQITGTIKDASGGVMAKVKVTVSSQLTGLTREAATNDSGDYVFPLLPVGLYSVSAEQQGFRAATRTRTRARGA